MIKSRPAAVVPLVVLLDRQSTMGIDRVVTAAGHDQIVASFAAVSAEIAINGVLAASSEDGVIAPFAAVPTEVSKNSVVAVAHLDEVVATLTRRVVAAGIPVDDVVAIASE